MEFFPLASGVLVLAAVFAWVNHRWLRWPTTIGVMAISVTASLALVGLDALGAPLREPAVELLEELHRRGRRGLPAVLHLLPGPSHECEVTVAYGGEDLQRRSDGELVPWNRLHERRWDR